MPWNKKTKDASDWKPVRVRKGWMDLVRKAGEGNPKVSPTLNLTTCSEPKLLEYACQVACSYILGWFDPVHQKELVEANLLKTVSLVTKVFGASARQESEGWISIVEDGEVVCYLSPDMNIAAAPYFRNDKKKGREVKQRKTT